MPMIAIDPDQYIAAGRAATLVLPYARHHKAEYLIRLMSNLQVRMFELDGQTFIHIQDMEEQLKALGIPYSSFDAKQVKQLYDSYPRYSFINRITKKFEQKFDDFKKSWMFKYNSPYFRFLKFYKFELRTMYAKRRQAMYKCWLQHVENNPEVYDSEFAYEWLKCQILLMWLDDGFPKEELEVLDQQLLDEYADFARTLPPIPANQNIMPYHKVDKILSKKFGSAGFYDMKMVYMKEDRQVPFRYIDDDWNVHYHPPADWCEKNGQDFVCECIFEKNKKNFEIEKEV